MTEVQKQRNPTKIMEMHKKRHTLNPAMIAKDIHSLDLDDNYLGIDSFDEKKQATKNKFAVKAFLKNCYSKYTNG